MRANRRVSAAWRWVWRGLGLAAAAFAVWGLAARYLHIRAERVADARAWAITGPACPQIDEAELMRDVGAGLRSFTYADVTFFRREGFVECAPIYEDGGRGDAFHPVCQFTGPGDLRVRTTRGDWRFRPGRRPATVSVANGEARCVMASRLAGR